MKVLRYHILFTALILPFSALAQSFPTECEGPGLQSNYATFSKVFTLSMLQRMCVELLPATEASFDRVLDRYRQRSPTCYEATLAIPELAAFRSSPEVADAIQKHRSGAFPKTDTQRLLHECETIEATEAEREREEQALDSLFPKFPEPASDG